jgi:hypothetical protein
VVYSVVSAGEEMKVSQSEYKAIVAEVAERLKDAVYFSAEKKADEMLQSLGIKGGISKMERDDTELRFTFTVALLIGDIHQIIARQRRKK